MLSAWAATGSLERGVLFPNVNKKEYFTLDHIYLQESIAQIYFPSIYSIILQNQRKIKENNTLRK